MGLSGFFIEQLRSSDMVFKTDDSEFVLAQRI